MILDSETEAPAPPRADEAKVDVFDELSRHWRDARRNAAWYLQATRDTAMARARSALLKALLGAAVAVAALTMFIGGCALLFHGMAQLAQSRFDLSAGAAHCLVGGALIVLVIAAAALAIGLWRRSHQRALRKKYRTEAGHG